MRKMKKQQTKRQAGVLVSISSIPGPFGIGDFGPDARSLIDRLQESGIRCMSILPINPTSYGNSPYQSPSAFAGNIYFISLQCLFEDGLLTRRDLEAARCRKTDTVDYGELFNHRAPVLKKAFLAFSTKGGLSRRAYKKFCRDSKDWLDDFAAFMAIKETQNYQDWSKWPEELAFRQEPAYSRWIAQHQEAIVFWKFTQFVFFAQWNKLREYANRKGIEIIGDMPFYVAADSADVWSSPELFAMDPKSGRVRLRAGVPSDGFSDGDRSWGNPTYNWKNHKADNYKWFRERIRLCGSMYDCLRIDHVIAIKRYFGIKDGETSGRWYDGPEMEDTSLTEAICQEAEKSGLDIIVEDLGQIPEGLRERMKEIGWPGMRVLQFAFTGHYGAKSNHLPFYHRQDMVVYTGTHDNPALKEFLDETTDEELRYMCWWTRETTREGLQWALIEEVLKSPADRVIIPLQDLLGLGREARMVYSDDYERSWQWRLPCLEQFHEGICRRMKKAAVLTGRYDVKDQEEFSKYLDE